jgi:hypothetical protein
MYVPNKRSKHKLKTIKQELNNMGSRVMHGGKCKDTAAGQLDTIEFRYQVAHSK